VSFYHNKIWLTKLPKKGGVSLAKGRVLSSGYFKLGSVPKNCIRKGGEVAYPWLRVGKRGQEGGKKKAEGLRSGTVGENQLISTTRRHQQDEYTLFAGETERAGT